MGGGENMADDAPPPARSQAMPSVLQGGLMDKNAAEMASEAEPIPNWSGSCRPQEVAEDAADGAGEVVLSGTELSALGEWVMPEGKGGARLCWKEAGCVAWKSTSITVQSEAEGDARAVYSR